MTEPSHNLMQGRITTREDIDRIAQRIIDNPLPETLNDPDTPKKLTRRRRFANFMLKHVRIR